MCVNKAKRSRMKEKFNLLRVKLKKRNATDFV